MPEILRRLTAGRRFVARILDYERWRLRQCWLLLAYLRQQRYNRIAIYGEPALAEALTMLAGYLDLSVESVTPLLEETSELAGPDVPVILATFLCVQDWRNVLTASGVRDDQIHVLV
jgi:hypothetical protein